MKKLNQNVFGVPNSQMTKALENKLQKEQNHISTAVSAAMNLQALEPNHYVRKQKFAVQVLLLSAILMTANFSLSEAPGLMNFPYIS